MLCWGRRSRRMACAEWARWIDRNIQRVSTTPFSVLPSKPGEGCGPATSDRSSIWPAFVGMVTETGCDASCAVAKPGLQTATPANTDTAKGSGANGAAIPNS